MLLSPEDGESGSPPSSILPQAAVDALANDPARAPLEPIIAGLNDPVPDVRCAALETLGNMGDRASEELYPVLQAMSGADPSPQVRQRATRALLILKGFSVGPIQPITFVPTQEELGK